MFCFRVHQSIWFKLFEIIDISSGLVLCVLSGLLYGQTFTPAINVQDNTDGASKNGMKTTVK